MSGHVHVYPVDRSLTAEDAWKEVCIFGRRVTYTGGEQWTVYRCDGEECAGIEEDRVASLKGTC